MKFLGLVDENPPKVDDGKDIESEDDKEDEVEEENTAAESKDTADQLISGNEISNQSITTDASDQKSTQSTHVESKPTTKATPSYESTITFPPEEEKKVSCKSIRIFVDSSCHQ